MKTNQDAWQFVYGTSETSMNRVSQISNTFFDFGSPPMTQTQASETTVTMDNSSAGGGDAP
jgi:hypothetical protein